MMFYNALGISFGFALLLSIAGAFEHSLVTPALILWALFIVGLIGPVIVLGVYQTARAFFGPKEGT